MAAFVFAHVYDLFIHGRRWGHAPDGMGAPRIPLGGRLSVARFWSDPISGTFSGGTLVLRIRIRPCALESRRVNLLACDPGSVFHISDTGTSRGIAEQEGSCNGEKPWMMGESRKRRKSCIVRAPLAVARYRFKKRYRAA